MSYGQAYKKATSPQPGGCGCLILLVLSAITAIAEREKIIEFALFFWASFTPISQWVVGAVAVICLIIIIIGILPINRDGA